MPSRDEVARLYPVAYYGQGGRKFPWPVEVAVAAFARLQAAWLARGLARGESALDVGCGRGALLRGLAAHGLRAVGTELPGAAPELPAPCEVREVARLAEAGWEAGGFGLVVLWHVLEHLPDPRATLTEARRLLRPGGRLVVSVPNLDSVQARWAGPNWFHLDPPRHLHHFTAAALRALLEDLGFRVLGERHLSLRQNPFGWIQSALDKTGRWPRNALYASLLRGASPTIPRRTRWLLLGLALAAAPLAVVSSLIEALLRRGGTVTLTAERQGASSEEDDLRDQMTSNN